MSLLDEISVQKNKNDNDFYNLIKQNLSKNNLLTLKDNFKNKEFRIKHSVGEVNY